MYDKPFQWGSKRTGPDLARVGGKYSDEWQLQHLVNPRALVPQSIMPGYPFLATRELEYGDIAAHMKANRLGGVPYSDQQIEAAIDDLRAQADPDHPKAADFQKRYPKALQRDFDGKPKQLTEADALIAYLQMLGTLVDFKLYDAKANER
jgi:cytochrome c oxidase cbb3-type subunit 2